eukprot:gnl/MRDRNA2_/MRDRNA2_115301_c0_seq1.p1 gnl/MRDRNA2_/MRDRNA2_115301_c0~~gnl/MRDRNA2_/MRDRNA2_115301_c0_seq1.p1  ORF type:complete len:651 (-),score=156.24 gnl/MRDRNA2_/MRDRNA2_115301_c0_seq1:23-1975(-)
MNAIKCLAAQLQDNKKLEQLQKSLAELPKFLGKVDQDSYYYGVTDGHYNFHFDFRLEGNGFFQTGILVASATSRPVDGIPVPLKCKWKRRVGDIFVEIPGISSNMYQISADDIGTDIQVEAQPADSDEGHQGTALGEIGPFELDPSTRRSLDNALGAGGNKFQVHVLKGSKSDEPQRQDLEIHVNAEAIKVVQPGVTERSNKEVSAEYSMDYPKVIIHPLDTTKFQLVMNDKQTFHLNALSRTSRDLIALTIRCFHARKYMSTATVLNELFPSPAGANSSGGYPTAPPSPAVKTKNVTLDSCILLERLTKELNRAMSQKDVAEKVLRNTNKEKKNLHDQLEETITGYTSVIESLQDQCGGSQSSSPGDVSLTSQLQHQLRDVQGKMQALEQEKSSVQQKLLEAQKANKVRSDQQEIQRLQGENVQLRARLDELGGNSLLTERNAQAHAAEMKRLRNDVEALHNQKEGLRKRLAMADQEKRELTDNFLYVKGELDKVQVRQSGTSQDPAVDHELARLRENFSQAVDERNRISMQVESMSRNLERGKCGHDASLERVMEANARLMEEKDRIEKEGKRTAQLYADSVRQLQQQQAGLMTSAYGIGGRPGQASGQVAEDIRNLQHELAQRQEALAQKEAENDSLKTRIRKLAVA